MGRFHILDEDYQHEGFAVAYVPASWAAEAQAIDLESKRPAAVVPPYELGQPLRELGRDDDRCIVKGVRVAGYACDCGWRARPVLLEQPLEWMPRILLWTEAIDAQLALEWSQHVEACLARGAPTKRRSRSPASPPAAGEGSRNCRQCGRALEPNATAAASQRLTELLERLELRAQQPGETEGDHRLRSAERYESQIIHARVAIAHVLDDLADTCVFCSRRAREL